MDPTQFAKRYPSLFHVSKAPLETIRSKGLRSAKALVEGCKSTTDHVLVSQDDGITFSSKRTEWVLESHRPTDWVIRHPEQETKEVRLRNQRPLVINTLKKKLSGNLLPSDWIRMLNGFVFLFPRNPENEPMVKKEQNRLTVVELDTSKLCKAVGDDFWKKWYFSQFNLGAAIYDAKERGRQSFKSLLGKDQETSLSEVLVEGRISESVIRSAMVNAFVVRKGNQWSKFKI